FGRPNPAQGRSAQPNFCVLVQAVWRCSESPRHGEFRRVPGRSAGVSRAACRTLDDRKENETAAGRMRRARLSRGFRLERISAIAERLRNQASSRTKARIAIARTNLYPGAERRR